MLAGHARWRGRARIADLDDHNAAFSSSPFPPSIRCWSGSGRSRSAGMRSPISSASCSAGSMPARSIRNERLWGGPAPLTVVDFDDFVLWVTLGIILGGRIGYVLFYNLPHFAEHPLEIVAAVEGGMSFHGGFAGCVLAVVLFARSARHLRSCRSATSPARSGRSACSSAASPISSMANCGAGRPTCPGRWCFPAAGRCRAIRASSTRRRSKAWCCSSCSALLMRAGALKRPGLDHRRVRGRSTRSRGRLRILPRARCAARLPVGRRDHGHAAVGAAVPRRPRLHRGRAEASAAARHDDGRASCRSKPRSAGASRRPGRCRSAEYMALCLSRSASTATTPRAIRSARAAISSPRRRSARCSAS